MTNQKCPACNAKKNTPTEIRGVVRCKKCSGLYTTHHIPLGQTYSLVKPWLDNTDCPVENWEYFDFQFLSSKGLGRRHGWFNPANGLITQVG
jgi:hypothetical protein